MNYNNYKTELNRCVIESLWYKYDVSRKSLEVAIKRFPRVVSKERALELNAQWDSIVMGWKICESEFFFITAGNQLAKKTIFIGKF